MKVDRERLIERIYDVALEPAEFEKLVELWHAADEAAYEEEGFGSETLSHHFERAVALMDRLAPREGDAGPSRLEPLSHRKALLFDENLRLVEASETARQAFNLGPDPQREDLPFPAEDGKVFDALLRKTLEQAPEVTGIYHVPQSVGSNDRLLYLRRTTSEDGKPLVLAVTEHLGWTPQVAESLAQSFELSTTEIELVQQSIEVDGLPALAERRGRSYQTVRSQMKSIYSKTQTGSQTELLRLVLSLMALPKQGGRATDASVAPFEAHCLQRQLKTPEGRRVDYLVLGDPKGKPVLYGADEIGLFRFGPRIERAARDRGLRILVPIFPGYGATSPAPARRDYTSTMAADMLAILDQEQADQVPILTSGPLVWAAEVVRRAPGRFIALIGAPGILPHDKEDYARMSTAHRLVLQSARFSPSTFPFIIKAGFLFARRAGKRAWLDSIFRNVPADLELSRSPEVYEALVRGSRFALSEEISAHDAFARALREEQRDLTPEVIDRLNAALPVHIFAGWKSPHQGAEVLPAKKARYPEITFHDVEEGGQLLLYSEYEAIFDLVRAQFSARSPN